MKRIFGLLVLFLPVVVFAQQAQPPKYALVIGNGAYSSLTPLANPVNDANDVADALQRLGFTVDKVINGNLSQMDNAVIQLKNRLSVTKNAYGFFFYAGHGVQSGGENYLIPADANIPGANFLRSRSMSVQAMMDEINDAGNSLNVIVLDACRDNPFGWGRSGGRGLAVISHQPAESIIVYATSAGQQASDGQGRNGLFTSHLLPNLLTPGLEVAEIFRRTGADVAEASSRAQVPAVYNQFFGTAYLGPSPATAGASETQVVRQFPVAQPSPMPLPGGQERTKPGRDKEPGNAARLHTVGVSAGSAFSAPWFIGTVRGTYSPFNYSFAELGMDVGLVNNAADAGYFSLYPYLHYNFFMPFRASGGLYAGIGAGYMFSRYAFNKTTTEYAYLSGDSASFNIFAGDIVVGVNIFDTVDISYTLRTNFKSMGSKFSVGYTKRFNTMRNEQ